MGNDFFDIQYNIQKRHILLNNIDYTILNFQEVHFQVVTSYIKMDKKLLGHAVSRTLMYRYCDSVGWMSKYHSEKFTRLNTRQYIILDIYKRKILYPSEL